MQQKICAVLWRVCMVQQNTCCKIIAMLIVGSKTSEIISKNECPLTWNDLLEKCASSDITSRCWRVCCHLYRQYARNENEVQHHIGEFMTKKSTNMCDENKNNSKTTFCRTKSLISDHSFTYSPLLFSHPKKQSISEASSAGNLTYYGKIVQNSLVAPNFVQ